MFYVSQHISMSRAPYLSVRLLKCFLGTWVQVPRIRSQHMYMSHASYLFVRVFSSIKMLFRYLGPSS